MTSNPSNTNSPSKKLPGWAIHRRLYDWVLSLAQTPHATWWLFLLSFAESSFFPIPPDVLLGPLCMSKRSKAWWFATVCTTASVLGAIVGYAIGWSVWEAVDQWVFAYIPGFSQEKFNLVQRWYEWGGVWVLFFAAFTPLPFKIFTIVGGVLAQPFLLFLLVSAVGRGARFFLVAGVFKWMGPKAMPFIDKYFNWLCIVFVVLLAGGFAVLKYLH
jgi:membrane protein YqaA with SNARE-associated domain